MNYFVMPVLKDVSRTMPARSTIINRVCTRYGVTFEELKAKSRKREYVFPRHLLMYLLTKKAGMTLADAGRLLDRDHTTVIHAIKCIEDYIETDCFGKREEILTIY